MSRDHVTYTCGECDAKLSYRPDYESDMPEDWFRLEDNACVYVLCSVRCLRALVETLEQPPAERQAS